MLQSEKGWRALLLLICLSPGGCNPSGTAPTDVEIDYSKGSIVFVGAGAADPLWPLLRVAGERLGREGFGLPVRFVAPDTISPAAQVRLVREQLNDPMVRGLCVQVIDAGALAAVLDQAMSRGVYVVTLMQEVRTQLRSAHVGLDEVDVGRHLARAAADCVGENGTIMILRSTADDPRFTGRLAGLEEELGELGTVHVLGYADCSGMPHEARRTIRERSRRYPSLGAWVCLDDWPLNGGERTDEWLPPGCRIVSVGPLPVYWRALESGACAALIGTDYGQLGYEAVRLCQAAVASRTVDVPRRLLPARTVTRHNLEKFRRTWIEWSAPPEDLKTARSSQEVE